MKALAPTEAELALQCHPFPLPASHCRQPCWGGRGRATALPGGRDPARGVALRHGAQRGAARARSACSDAQSYEGEGGVGGGAGALQAERGGRISPVRFGAFSKAPHETNSEPGSPTPTFSKQPHMAWQALSTCAVGKKPRLGLY